MVHKWPSKSTSLETDSEAEIITYEILSKLNDDWCFWHSKEWCLRHFGEADFLIFNPSYGFIVLEVKGGSISIEDDQWFTTPIRGPRKGIKSEIKDPFRQARRSMFAFLQIYKSEAQKQRNREDLLKDTEFPGNYSFGVVTSDCNFKDACNKQKPINVETSRVYDGSDIEQGVPIEDFLISLFRKNALRHIPDAVKTFFPQMMTGNLKTQVSLQTRLIYQAEQIARINEIQDNYIVMTEPKVHCMFKGSAGTGKTFIAIKKAIRVFSQGNRVLFLCYNRELKNFVKIFLKSKLDSKDLTGLIDVENVHSFFLKLSKDHQTSSEQILFEKLMERFHERNSQLQIKGIILKIIEKKLLPKYQYDTIIIDEAQDIPAIFADLFNSFRIDSRYSNFYVFYDDSQAIFTGDFSVENFGMSTTDDVIYLPKNIRNVESVIEWVQDNTQLGNYYEKSGIEGIAVKTQLKNTFQDCLYAIIREVFTCLVSDHITLDRMIVLADKRLAQVNPELDFFHQGKIKDTLSERNFIYRVYGSKKYPKIPITLVEPEFHQDLSLIEKKLQTRNLLLFNGIGTFKGLERDFVFLIIPNLGDLKMKATEDNYKEIKMKTYVGATRARFILSVFQYLK